MRAKEFQKIIKDMGKLTPNQRKELSKKLTGTMEREKVEIAIETRAGENPKCPSCGSESVNRWGWVSGLQRYRCKECKQTFNALTGTPLSRLRYKERWLSFSEELKEGSSVRKAAKRLKIHRNTSFRWRHRFLSLPENQRPEKLQGIAEADETYFRLSFKGKKDLLRPSRKRGSQAKKRGTSLSEYVPVLIARDRSGATSDEVLQKFDTKEVSRVLESLIAPDAVLVADGAAPYRIFAKERDITIKALNMSAGIRVIDKVFHIQNVNAYDSRLKSWMRRFNGVATHYLPRYLGWRRLLEHHGNQLTPYKVLLSALGTSTYSKYQHLKVT